MQYQYTLEPYKGGRSRYSCPGCGEHKTFARYINTATGEQLADDVGRCNRQVNCGYHYTPAQYFKANKLNPSMPYFKPVSIDEHSKLMSKEMSLIPDEVFNQSLKNYGVNNLILFLLKRFGNEITEEVIRRYPIGTSRYWKGATVFWLLDCERRVRTGKIMMYDPETGRRSKERHHAINWVHKVLKLPDFHLKQCCYGEDLLRKERLKPVAICESEKTAIICSIYFPEYIWLACGSLNGLNIEKCKVLQGRNVVLFPDLNAFDQWSTKAKELSHIAHVVVSDLLEQKATDEERDQGLDLADYLLRYPVSAFRSQPLQLYSKDMHLYNSYTHTGKDFDKMIIAGFTSKEGKVYDVLFDREEILIKPGEHAEAVKRLEDFFEKRFEPAFFDGQPCLVHQPVQ